MKKDVAKMWVEALRSGKYEQGTGALNINGKFCCLGVLCDISKVGEWTSHPSGLDLNTYVTKNSPTYAQLPGDVQLWAGMSTRKGYFKETTKKIDACLSNLNDCGLSFNDIANIIERNWEIL